MKRVRAWIAVLFGVAAVMVIATIIYARLHSKPYATPIVENPSGGEAGAFLGLVDLAESSPSKSVKALWIHGMCTHPPLWVDNRVARLAAAIGGKHETTFTRPIGPDGALLRGERFSVRSTTIDILFLTWSPLTEPFKEDLAFDYSTVNGGEFPYARATLNRGLKQNLINDCVTDLVVYGGANGNPIRRAVAEAVCEVLGGRGDGTSCDVTAGEPPKVLALVTESLGSKLLFDGLLETHLAVERTHDKVAINRLADSLAATRMLYLVSNQVPLLAAAGSATEGISWEPSERAAKGSSIAGVFALLAQARLQRPPEWGQVTAVAFSDPNDLLSYRIVPKHLAKYDEHFRLINVIVSNDSTYMGFVERPDTAHCGYFWNPHVLELLARGYRPGQVLPELPDVTVGSCAGNDRPPEIRHRR